MMGCVVSVMKNVSLLVVDCVTAGMPLLQGLASRLSVVFEWLTMLRYI